MEEFWIRIFVDIVLIGLLSVVFGSWLNFKYNKKLKLLEPLTAEQTLRRENYLNSKREVFFEFINLMNLQFASTHWSGPDVPENRLKSFDRPSEVDINSCFSKLNLYVDNEEILKRFSSIFSGKTSPVQIGEMISLLRQDLGYGESALDSNDYKYIFNLKN